MNPAKPLDDTGEWTFVERNEGGRAAYPKVSLSARCVYGVGYALRRAARGVYETNWVQKVVDSAVGAGSTYMLGPFYGPAIAMGVGFYNTDVASEEKAKLKKVNAAQRAEIEALKIALEAAKKSEQADGFTEQSMRLTPAADAQKQASIEAMLLEASSTQSDEPKPPRRRNSAIH